VSLDNLKRLNVISDFEVTVDRHLTDEYYPIKSHSGSGWMSSRFCIAIPRPAILNQKEQEFITANFKLRKSFDAGFFTLQEIKQNRRLGRMSCFSSTIQKSIELTFGTDLEAVYFLVARARW
jgi:hypothetical protein